MIIIIIPCQRTEKAMEHESDNDMNLRMSPLNNPE